MEAPTLMLGGKERVLEFTVNDMAEFEDFYKAGMTEMLKVDETGNGRLGVSVILSILHLCIRKEQRSITRADVGNMVQEYLKDSGDLIILGEAAIRAVRMSGLLGGVRPEPEK